MIKYAGVPLTLSTPQIERWVSDNLDLSDWLIGFADERFIDRKLAWRRQRPMPQPRIGCLHWPAGASRWATGWFLASESQLSSILEVVGVSEPTAQAFQIGSSTAVAGFDTGGEAAEGTYRLIETDLFLLPPIALAYTGGARKNLYLLPLVDERYFWNNEINTDGLSVWDATDDRWGNWTTLKDLFVDAMGIDISLGTSIVSEWQFYDKQAFWHDPKRKDRRASLPMLLDAYAANIGRTVVRQFDGSVGINSIDSAATTHTVNLKNFAKLRRAGTDVFGAANPMSPAITTPNFAGLRGLAVPASVIVTFPKTDRNTGFEARGTSQEDCWYESEVTLASLSLADFSSGSIADYKRLIVDSASAMYANDENFSGDPTNKTALDALAIKIATDFYKRLTYSMDSTFNGVCRFIVNAAYDSIEVVYRKSDCSTRVRSEPLNNYPDCFQHQVENSLDPVGDYQVVTLTGTLSAGGSANATITRRDGSTGTIKVWDNILATGSPGQTIASGRSINVLRDEDEEKWWFVSTKCSSVSG